jgi:Flp pilus assembly pilin Flp
MKKFLVNLLKDESGISSVEYALLVAFIGGGIIFAADALGDAVGNEINTVADCIALSSEGVPDASCNSI